MLGSGVSYLLNKNSRTNKKGKTGSGSVFKRARCQHFSNNAFTPYYIRVNGTIKDFFIQLVKVISRYSECLLCFAQRLFNQYTCSNLVLQFIKIILGYGKAML